jgi:uncharacterized protein (TIGR03086 family)
VIEDPSDAVATLIALGRDREAAIEGLRSVPAKPHELPAGGTTVEPLAQFAQLGPILGGVVGSITPDQLSLPTPCVAFTVEGILKHMIEGATAFAAAFRGEQPTPADTSDVLAAFAPALGGLGAAVGSPGALDRTIAAPFGSVPGATFARFVVLDGLVHGWDLAMATGQSYGPSAELVGAVSAFAQSALDGLRDGTTFAAPTTAPPGASSIEQLAAFTGRVVPTR